MIEGPAEHKHVVHKPKCVITIPIWMLQISILCMVVVSAMLIAFIGYSMTGSEDLSVRVGAGVIIGFIQMFVFIGYRSFLRFMWGVKPE